VTSLSESSQREVGDNREKSSCPKGQVEKYVNVEAWLVKYPFTLRKARKITGHSHIIYIILIVDFINEDLLENCKFEDIF
jgi:hypothetical protein